MNYERITLTHSMLCCFKCAPLKVIHGMQCEFPWKNGLHCKVHKSARVTLWKLFWIFELSIKLRLVKLVTPLPSSTTNCTSKLYFTANDFSSMNPLTRSFLSNPKVVCHIFSQTEKAGKDVMFRWSLLTTKMVLLENKWTNAFTLM